MRSWFESLESREQVLGLLAELRRVLRPDGSLLLLGPNARYTKGAYWDFEIQQPGTFDVQILQGCGPGHGGSTANFSFYPWGSSEPAVQFAHVVKDTGHWQNFEPLTLGVARLEQGKYRLRVDATKKAKAAVMDLRQVLLTPTTE